METVNECIRGDGKKERSIDGMEKKEKDLQRGK